MLHTVRRRAGQVLLRVLPCLLAAAPVSGAWAATPRNQPDERVNLMQLGYQVASQDLLLLGYSLLSVEFVDSQHVLFSYNARTLMRRIPNDPPEDNDQSITALLLQLPSKNEGVKVVGRADWRMHDHLRYLWPLGHGRFLLRQGLELRLLAPLEHIATNDPLQTRLFMKLDRPAAYLQLSPEKSLMVLELAGRPAGESAAGPAPLSDYGSDRGYEIQFIRLNPEATSAEQLSYRIAGQQHSPVPLEIPIIPEGYLDAIRGDNGRWLFTFGSAAENSGRRNLTEFLSSCRPNPSFVSDREFLAIACDHDQRVLVAFGLDGTELWYRSFSENFAAPSFLTSEASDRFAFTRIQTVVPLSLGEPLGKDSSISQEIRVMDTRSGKQVLRAYATPMQRDGQNLALSPDGRRLALVRDGWLEVFNLPPVETAGK